MAKATEQREWIIPCNLNFYDLENALTDLQIIDWKQPKVMNNAQVGDLIYIYCKKKGTGSICYKGAILAVNKTEDIIDDSRYQSDGLVVEGPCFELAVFRSYCLNDELTYAKLKEAGLKSRLQGPTVVSGSVADYLHHCDDLQKAYDRFDGSIPRVCLVNFPIPVKEIYSKESLEQQKEYKKKREELLKKKEELQKGKKKK